MRQSAAEILRRWMKLDRRLRRGNLRVSEFADECGVNPKTIRRDMAVFKALGYGAVLAGPPDPGEEYLWAYPRGRQPMFTATTSPRPPSEPSLFG